MIMATIFFSTMSYSAYQYDYNFAHIKAGSLEALQIKIEESTALIDGSIEQFIPGIVFVKYNRCGKLLKSDRDEPRYRWNELKKKTARIVTEVETNSYFSFDNGDFVEIFRATIKFKCRVSRR